MSLFKNNLFRRIKDAAVKGLASLFGVGGPPSSSSNLGSQVASTIGNIFGPTVGAIAQVGADVFGSRNISPLQPISLPKTAVFLPQPGSPPGATPTFFPSSPLDSPFRGLIPGPTPSIVSPAQAVGAPPRPVPSSAPSAISVPPVAAAVSTQRIIQVPGGVPFDPSMINAGGVANMSLVSGAIKLAQRIPQILRGPAAQSIGIGVGSGIVASAVVDQFQAGTGGACPAGWHLNKQNSPKGAAGSYCVRNRRMNVLNGRAARRSVRRIKGAMKQLKTIQQMMPSKPRARRAPATRHLTGPEHTS